MEQAVNPIVGPSGFISVHEGFLYVYFIDVADVLSRGFTLVSLDKYMEAKDKDLDKLPVFGMGPNSHAFFPCGTVPIFTGIPSDLNNESPVFVSFVINYVLDSLAFQALNPGIRGEICGYLTRSMAHGLEKVWVASGNMTACKKWVDQFNQVAYKDSEDESLGGCGRNS